MTSTHGPEVDAATVAAFCRGDDDAFERISRRHFRELHIYCYRMVGSFDEAEDLVQETFLRAWRKRDTYESRATLRSWLYRIATNVCIDTIRKRGSRSKSIDDAGSPMYAELPWLQPYPDPLLDTVAASDAQPDALIVERETIELAFLATIQILPAKQRAVLILRDALDFSAIETAEILNDTPAAVNSALQRARTTLRQRRGKTGASSATPQAKFDDLVFLQIYMDAVQRGDIEAILDLLRNDVRMTLLPDGATWDGREAVACEFLKRKDDFGDAQIVRIAANRQPAIAVYRRQPGEAQYRASAIVLLGVIEGKLREIATFASPELFVRFELPSTVPERTIATR